MYAVVLLNIRDAHKQYFYVHFFSFIVCPKGSYGKDCKQRCPCNDRGACDEVRRGDKVNGKVKCFCDDGYDGENCEYSKYF
jgi:hypothetical protein